MKIKVFNLFNLAILLTFIAFSWVIAVTVKPFLHYHLQQTAFLVTSDFLLPFLRYPGGIGDYLGEFLAQFFAFNVAGSVLISMVAAIQGLLVMDTLRRMDSSFRWKYLVFGLVMVLAVFVMGDFKYPYYVTVRLLLALLFCWIYIFLAPLKPAISIPAWVLMAVMLIYLAGGAALFVFVLSSIFIFWKKFQGGWKYMWIALFLVIGAVLPFLAHSLIFQTGLKNTLSIVMEKPPAMLAYSPGSMVYIYYAILPLCLLLLVFLSGLAGKVAVLVSRLKIPAFITKAWFGLLMQLIVVMAAGYLFLSKAVDPVKKNLLLIEYYADNREWKEVINMSTKLKSYDFRINFHVNRALWFIGALPDRMMEYPQLLGSHALFVDADKAKSEIMPTSDLYFDLGSMSESMHWAYEMQTLQPYSPRCLKRLVLINIIKRDWLVAQKFLDVLDHNMLCSAWVDKYQGYLNDTTMAASDPLIAEKRRFTPKLASINTGPEECLNLLMATNGKNRMAYDYLMSYYLLEMQLPKFLRGLEFFKTFKPTRLPVVWEEALTVVMFASGKSPAEIQPGLISNACLKRYQEFQTGIRKHGGNPELARPYLTREFYGTYWFYLQYLNPKVTNVLNKTAPVK
ncbi:MAG: DUF6057 family protein [Bacteroidales bacterium]